METLCQGPKTEAKPGIWEQIHSIDSGSLIIAFPYDLGVYSVEFNGFKNDLSSGSATVTKDGISKVVNAIDTKIVMLQ